MENEHAATKPQDDVYKLYEFYSILSATHGNRAVKILANLYGLTTIFGTNSVRTIGSQWKKVTFMYTKSANQWLTSTFIELNNFKYY